MIEEKREKRLAVDVILLFLDERRFMK